MAKNPKAQPKKAAALKSNSAGAVKKDQAIPGTHAIKRESTAKTSGGSKIGAPENFV